MSDKGQAGDEQGDAARQHDYPGDFAFNREVLE